MCYELQQTALLLDVYNKTRWQRRGRRHQGPPAMTKPSDRCPQLGPPSEDKAGLTVVWKRVACEWLLFNLYLVPHWSQRWDQSRKWKHMSRVSRIRGPPHTRQRDGKRQWELMWRNGLNKQSLQSPAPYYPIIYTAWELGNARPLETTIGFHWEVACHASCQSKRPGIIVKDKFWILSGLMCLF